MIDPDATPDDAQAAPGPTGAAAGYDDHHHPLGAYRALTAVFGVAFTGSLVALHTSGHRLPERVAPQDIVLVGVATHKLTRMIAKDRVTGSLRAPFTRFQGAAGHGEVDEQPRGTGLQRAVGELLICPYCLAQWVTGAFTVGLVGAPRVTRLLAAMWSAEALSDGLQLAYSTAKSD